LLKNEKIEVILQVYWKFLSKCAWSCVADDVCS